MSKDLLRAVPVPGQASVNTIGSMFPNNANSRPNNINGTDLQNGVGSFPKDINQGLAKQQENIRILADTFEAEIASRGFEGHRQFFDKVTIPRNAGTMSKVFAKTDGIDEKPTTAALTGLTGWNPSWNEVALEGSSIEVTMNAYGRFFKKHRLAEDVSYYNWFAELASKFADNANRTLDNLAGYRIWEGANKMYVQSVAAFDPQQPLAARLTLAANAATVDAHLTWDALLEAKHQFENYEEIYSVVNPANGSITKEKRRAVINGYAGDEYMVVVGRNGYNQLLADPNFRSSFVVNGGYYAQQVGEGTLGIATPIYGLRIQIVKNPITISKEATPKVSTDGQQTLEVAWVVGGKGSARIAVELTYEGWTKMIHVGYEEDPKVDPFSLLSITGWMTITDFAVIRNECFIAIPYKKHAYVTTGQIQKVDNWKK